MTESPESPVPAWKCPTCGNWMRWNPASKALVCPSCQTAAAPSDVAGATVVAHRVETDGFPPDPPINPTKVSCVGCGAPIQLELGVMSGTCSYCHAPFVATEHRAPPYPDGVVPATLDISEVESRMAAWAASRWFAPRAFRRGVRPTLALTYRPVWVIGAGTKSAYTGERGQPGGEYTRKTDETFNQEGLITWFPVNGTVEHDFPGVVVLANGFGRPEVSWQLDAALPYQDAFLVGATAFAPFTTWTDALDMAEDEMKDTITDLASAQIGGALQRVSSVTTSFTGLNYRYLLAPTWSGSYEWRDSTIKLEVNAATGEISGHYPRSKVQIALAVLAVVAIIAAILFAVVL